MTTFQRLFAAGIPLNQNDRSKRRRAAIESHHSRVVYENEDGRNWPRLLLPPGEQRLFRRRQPHQRQHHASLGSSSDCDVPALPVRLKRRALPKKKSGVLRLRSRRRPSLRMTKRGVLRDDVRRFYCHPEQCRRTSLFLLNFSNVTGDQLDISPNELQVSLIIANVLLHKPLVNIGH